MNKHISFPKSESVFKLLLIASIFSLPFYILRFNILSVPTTFLEILIYLTFIAGILSRQIKIKFDGYFFASLIFVLSAFVSVFIDPQITRSAGIFKAYFFDGFLIFLAIRYMEKDNIKYILPALVASGAIASLIALLMFIFGVKSSDGRLLDLDRLSPNYLTMFLVPIFVVGFYLLVDNLKKGKTIVLCLIADILILLAIVLSGSRGAYLSLPVGLAIVCAQFVGKKFISSYKTTVLILSFILIAGVLWLFRPSFGDTGRIGSSSNIRYYIWTTSIEIIEKNPLTGVGLSNFQDYFTQLTRGRVNYSEYIAPQALTAHNLYLHIYLTMGLLGIASFITMLLVFIINYKNPVALSALCSILIYGIVDTPFFRNDLSILLWILLALL